MELLSQVLDTFIGQIPVIVSPGEGFLDQLSGGEALHQANDLEVSHIRDVRVSLGECVFLGNDNALCG